MDLISKKRIYLSQRDKFISLFGLGFYEATVLF